MAIKIQALAASGNPIAARVLGEHFLDAFPDGPHASAVRAIVGPMPKEGIAVAILDTNIGDQPERADPVEGMMLHTGDPSPDAAKPWALLAALGRGESAPEGAIALDDISEVEHTGGGSLRVAAVALEVGEHSTRAPERISLLFGPTGTLIDVSPAPLAE